MPRLSKYVGKLYEVGRNLNSFADQTRYNALSFNS